jgi:hypothetical protein
MSLYIKEWPDNTVTLMTDGGRVIWTFASIEDAVDDGYEIIRSAVTYPDHDPARAAGGIGGRNLHRAVFRGSGRR